MSHLKDPVFQTIQRIRTPHRVEEAIAGAWVRWSGKPPQAVQIKPGLTHYKPFERARIMAEATITLYDETASTVKLNFFFHIFARAEDAEQEIERAHTQDFLPCSGPPVFELPQWRTVVWTLPNAPNLVELAELLTPEQFCQDLIPEAEWPSDSGDFPTPKLFRYVPLKRALLTWENPHTHRCYFAKLLREREAPAIIRNFNLINQAAERSDLGFTVPQLIAYDSERHTLLMSEVPGQQFTAVMHHFSPEPFAQVGRILARLHHCDLQPETIWTPTKELALLRRRTRGVSLALPDLEGRLNEAIAALDRVSQTLSFPTNHPIHGNLFGDQILYSPDGVGIVDWDALSLGDSLYDVGRLLAHLIYLAGCRGIAHNAASACAEALICGYEAETRQPLQRQRLAWHVATQLLFRGKISSLRMLPERWQIHLSFVVAETGQILGGRSRYLSLPALYSVLSEV
ncbi:MAG: phosphotransferase [Leptolyngbyaceae cyanobacterium MO_188.B28]|nr:phosphotransferase [Leptolyngbyaceae cyanobacterium MO_188.B28]